MCEDISFGKEDIPIPVINVIDNPPIAPPGKLLTNLCFSEGGESGRQTIFCFLYIYIYIYQNSFAYIFQASVVSQGKKNLSTEKNHLPFAFTLLVFITLKNVNSLTRLYLDIRIKS